MPQTTDNLVAICDDLLRAVSEHHKLWPSDAARVSKLIDRVLDIRNRISPPKPSTTKPTATVTPNAK